jgi:phospholipid/cholesterol/gamma-HCH transport system substrate-binding protein
MKRAIRAHLRDFVAVIGMFALASAVGAYILSEQRLRFPFIEEEPFAIYVDLQNAQGVTPGQGQTVRVAGMRVGDVGKVELKEGLARIRMDLDTEYDDLVRKDATVLLRPRTGLKDMFLALDPGSRKEPAVKEGGLVPAANSLPDVNADEITRMLDTDTRAYLKLLIGGAGKGLRGRRHDLREVFYRLGPLHRDLAVLNREVVKRKRNLARLVHNYGSTISRLGQEDEDLRGLVSSSSRVFGRLAREDQRISLAVSRLPSALRETQSTLNRVRTLGDVAGPAFRALRRPIRRVDDANSELRPLAVTGEPVLRKYVRPLVRTARPFVEDLRPAARDLSRAQPDLRASFHELNRFFNIAAYNPGGAEAPTGDIDRDRARDEGLLFWLGWLSHNTVSLFSTGDASGPFRRAIALASCSTTKALIDQYGGTTPVTQELLESALGVSDLLSDTTLCPPS